MINVSDTAGTVVDALTGQLLRDASVTARLEKLLRFGSGWANRSSSGSGPTTASAVADANGRFSIENLSPGRYIVFASQEGYLRQSRDDELRAERPVRISTGRPFP
jgi:hypothetical protein